MPGFHEGELAVQEQAGTRDAASRLTAMLAEPDLDGGAHRFLAAQRFAAFSARDVDGLLWTSALVGPPGFLNGYSLNGYSLNGYSLNGHGSVLDVRTALRPGDPLAGLVPGGQLGMVAIDFAARRRMRVNGTVASVAPGGFRVDVDQAYGNCPQYIHRRNVGPGEQESTTVGYQGAELTPDQTRLITAADTFFLGTAHPTRGADASHRGGPAGFVQVEDGVLWWPDYPGNNMFNSFGNLAVDPTASLLFVDFITGTTIHLSGTAAVHWDAPGDTGRRVRFVPQRVVEPAGPLLIQPG